MVDRRGTGHYRSCCEDCVNQRKEDPIYLTVREGLLPFSCVSLSPYLKLPIAFQTIALEQHSKKFVGLTLMHRYSLCRETLSRCGRGVPVQ